MQTKKPPKKKVSDEQLLSDAEKSAQENAPILEARAKRG